ncbi:hypothetical protein ACLOJK_016255 [Asimina triloba]
MEVPDRAKDTSELENGCYRGPVTTTTSIWVANLRMVCKLGTTDFGFGSRADPSGTLSRGWWALECLFKAAPLDSRLVLSLQSPPIKPSQSKSPLHVTQVLL